MSRKTIALVAHDARKAALAEWVEYNWGKLSQHNFVCTGTTGRKVYEVLEKNLHSDDLAKIEFQRLKSGPLGGDQQLGALIAEGRVEFFVFFWDTMSAQPHDVDVKALLRIATIYNVPVAMNRATADYLISSPLFHEDYVPEKTDFSDYQNRRI